MDYQLSESQQLLKRTAADFFAREYPLDRMRDFRLDRDANERELWTAITAMGWTAAPFTEDVGGYPGTFMDAAVLLEEMGRGASATPFVHSTIAAGLALASHASPVAADIAAGGRVVTIAPRTSIAAPGRLANGKVTGRYVAVPWVNLATHYLLPVDDGSFVLVAGHEAGVSVQRLDSAGADCIGQLDLDNVAVEAVFPAEFGEVAALNGAAGVSLILLGAGERALDLAVAYAKERIQFGKPIGTFQALQHKCADMHITLEVGRNLAYKAATLDGQPGFAQLARYAKAYFGEAAPRVTRDAIQVHGGVGFIDDHKVQLCYRLALGLANAYGAPGDLRRQVALVELTNKGR